MMQPLEVSNQLRQGGYSDGYESSATFLAPVPAVMVRQKLQVFEQFCPACEKKNFYRVGAIGTEAVHNPPDGDAFNAMNPHFVAQEDSSCACRFWCGNMRKFELLVSQAAGRDASGQPLLRMERPFRCTLCCFGCIANPQELNVSTQDGVFLGRVVQDWNCGRCIELCCFPGGFYYFQVQGPTGETNFYVRQKYPTLCNGCVNCCAPSCCNKAWVIDILDADGETVLSSMKNVFPGFNCRWVSDASNLVMEFPAKATPEQKSVLLGALFLIEYIFFEKQKQDNDNAGS
mmetsp:Transcript_13102/g.36862  ORF Transcript_13102/g.36862 Transcript_13102/m.36862 type:complete len:288 (-) Transcript_13102:90-953(-)